MRMTEAEIQRAESFSEYMRARADKRAAEERKRIARTGPYRDELLALEDKAREHREAMHESLRDAVAQYRTTLPEEREAFDDAAAKLDGVQRKIASLERKAEREA